MEDRGTRTTAKIGLSLVIPAYNEAESIHQAIAEADAALTSLGYDYEILVVDDGSTDETSMIVTAEMHNRQRVRLLRHEQNRGYGAALRTGFAAARKEFVAFTDADCQFHLQELAILVEKTKYAPMVVGYRQDRQDPAMRRFFSWGYNVLARTLLGTGVRDCDCALKVFRRSVLQAILPESSGFFVNTEMLSTARRLGLQIHEVGVHHRPRCSGASKVSLLDIPRTLRSFLPFWWSRVLFAGGTAFNAQSQGLMRTPAIWPTLGLLAILVGLLFFGKLTNPLLEPEEARYAEIPRQMIEAGVFTTPLLHGVPYYHKPPLAYWFVMAMYKLIGVHDWTARLMPALAAAATVLLTYMWGRKPFGSHAAFLSALILCLSARFVYLSRMLSLDVLLTLFVLAGLLAGYRALASDRFRLHWWIASAVAVGLGTLTKGPVAFVLVVVPIFSLCFLDTRIHRPSGRAWLFYGLTGAAVAWPWYVFLLVKDPHAFIDFIWVHHIIRFVAPIDHAEPFWFFLPGLVFGLLPWSLLLVPLAQFLTRTDTAIAQRRSSALGFFLLAAGWGLLFFSASGCKRPIYILPVIPPLAIAFGIYLAHGVDWQAMALGRRLQILLPKSDALIGYRLLLGLMVVGILTSLAAIEADLWSLSQGMIAVALLLTGLLVAILCQRYLIRPQVWTCCLVVLFLLQLGAVFELLPDYKRKFALRGEVRRHVPLVQQGQLAVICYPRMWDSVSFYLQNPSVQSFAADRHDEMISALEKSERSLVFIKADESFSRFLEALPPDLEFVPLPYQRQRLRVGLVGPRRDIGNVMMARSRSQGE